MDFDPKELERIIRKIKHCLALSASANEHEAAAAMRQAQKLMQKYRITEIDVQLSDVNRTEGAHAKAKRPAWDKNLGAVVAKTFNCKSFNCTSWHPIIGRRSQAVFIGVTPAPEIAKYAYDTLHFKVSSARREYVAKARRGELSRGRYTPETRGDHFAEAWVYQVHEKLLALVPEQDDTPAQAQSQAQALSLAENHDNALIEAFIHQITKGEGVGKARARKAANANLDDLIAGFLSGSQAEISHGLTTGAQTVPAIEAQ